VSCLGRTYTKIGTIQRRLAWPLRKDDTKNREAFHKKTTKKKKRFPSATETTGAGGGGRYMLGSGTDLYVCGLFVHPFFRGNLLKSVCNLFFLQSYKINVLLS